MLNQIEEIRLDLGWSLEDLAKISGFDVETIIEIENGQFPKESWIYNRVLNIIDDNYEDYDFS